MNESYPDEGYEENIGPMYDHCEKNKVDEAVEVVEVVEVDEVLEVDPVDEVDQVDEGYEDSPYRGFLFTRNQLVEQNNETEAYYQDGPEGLWYDAPQVEPLNEGKGLKEGGPLNQNKPNQCCDETPELHSPILQPPFRYVLWGWPQNETLGTTSLFEEIIKSKN